MVKRSAAMVVEASCHSERSAAERRVSPGRQERFFTSFRMTSGTLSDCRDARRCVCGVQPREKRTHWGTTPARGRGYNPARRGRTGVQPQREEGGTTPREGDALGYNPSARKGYNRSAREVLRTDPSFILPSEGRRPSPPPRGRLRGGLPFFVLRRF